jgi:hypothetical protein
MQCPLCYAFPSRVASTAWLEHVPFGMFLVDLLRPRVLVELGVMHGVSYCAFCQAVQELGLDTRCYGVDTWRGDKHCGTFGNEVLRNLADHHDAHYHSFSRLLQMTFDEAAPSFAAGSIDLLHIDGRHGYEDVRHDFELWLPKMSDRGVVLFHDTNERQPEFGVWRFWDEVRQRFPHFAFEHEHGLGVLAVGPNLPAAAAPLFAASDHDARQIRQFFFRLGRGLRTDNLAQYYQSESEQRQAAIGRINQEVDRLCREVAQLTQQNRELHAALAQLDAVARHHSDALAEMTASRAWKLAQSLSALRRFVLLRPGGRRKAS